jgi:hypothetical protein
VRRLGKHLHEGLLSGVLGLLGAQVPRAKRRRMVEGEKTGWKASRSPSARRASSSAGADARPDPPGGR